MHPFLRALAAAALLIGPAAHAGDPAWGLQGQVSIPQGDLSDVANMGLGVGGHALWDFGSGHALRARLDYTFYSEKSKTTTSMLGLGADYNYYFSGRQREFYLIAGLGSHSYHQSGDEGTRSGVGFAFGVGYQVDAHVGGELRYTTTNVKDNTMIALNLGVTYRF